ncbi:DUF2971 domain-containing protein [Lysinibacillus agricola]|uniref:DUF2971 domain-containing protein n=1 Tax=Lysinibacillus agricola TaxID=2590012 RepID=UPI003C257BF6
MWIEEYIKLMFPTNVNEMKMERAMRLKYQNTPNRLFKYRAFNEYSVNNFKNNEIWFNAADQFNDPYDCALKINLNNFVKDTLKKYLDSSLQSILDKCDIELSEDKISEFKKLEFKDALKFVLELDESLKGQDEKVDSFVNTVYQSIEEQNEEQLLRMNSTSQARMLISCFSEVNNSILMWSHYANNHSGFCVEYNFKKENVESLLTRTLQPVIYTDEILDMSEYFGVGREDKLNYNNLISTYAAIVKSNEWAYEKEWRISFPIGAEEGFSREIFPPEAIYLGTRMQDDYKQELIQIAQQKQISVYQMKMKTNEFKLITEQIL